MRRRGNHRAPRDGVRMTAVIARRDFGERLDSVAARGVTAIVVVGAIGIASQATSRALSLLGFLALAAAAVPYVFRDFRGRAAMMPVISLLLMYAVADAL